MNSNDLGKKLKIAPRTIQDKTQKSKEAGQDRVKIDDRVFRFKIVKGHYRFEEVFAEVIDTSDTDLSAAWRMASDEKKEEASLKYRLVKDYLRRPSNENWKKFLSRVEYRYRDIKPTKSKLFRWLDKVKWCEENNEVALEHLLDTRGKSTNNRSYTDEQFDFMAQLFLEKPHRKMVKIHQYMRDQFGEGCPSYATINRMMEKYKSENVFAVTVATNPEEANNKLRPAPGKADEHASYINAVWEMDGTPVDVMCSDGIRYQLSAAIDVYSRRPIVVVTPSASSTALSRVFKKGIEKLGVPEVVLLDNGKEYRSKTFEYTCARLKIEQRFTAPYSGWQKPHIERFFGTLTRDLFEELPGYIGHDVSDRKQLQSQETYQEKIDARARAVELMKHGNAAAKKLAKAQKEMDAYIPTTISRDDLERYIDSWIIKYETRHHRGIKETPIERWSNSGMMPKKISDTRVLDVLVGLSEKKRITKKGITWNGLSYWHDIFYDRVKESAWALSDDELGYLYVYDLDMKFLCRAENAEMLGKSRADYLASSMYAKKFNKLIRELRELRRDAPERWQSSLRESHIDEEDIGIEYKSRIVSNVRESMAERSEYTEAEKKKLDAVDEPTIVIGGRPMFSKMFDRFMWDLENDMVDENTKKLAAKHESIWEMAQTEYERRHAG